MYFKKKHFIDATNQENDLLLTNLEERMRGFYNQNAFEEGYWDYAENNNKKWSPENFPFHCDLMSRIKQGETVIDFGCGSAVLLANLNKQVRYIGLEWSEKQVAINRKRYPEAEFISGDVTKNSVNTFNSDWAISLFSLEHIVRPHLLIHNMLKSLKLEGKIAIICPNFINGMNSIRSGFRATTKRSKLKKIQLIDLLYSLIDEKILLPETVAFVHKSKMQFPIYLYPRCLDAPYFSDNDAIHLVNEQKILKYLISLKVSILTSSTDITQHKGTLYIVGCKTN